MRHHLKIFVLAVLAFMLGLTLVWADDYNYHGSGRDTSYSEKLDDYYSLGFVPKDHPVPGVVNVGVSTASPVPPPPPMAAVPADPNKFTVTFPDDHGRLIAVVIRRSPDGFVGPKGEHYPEFPKPWQLRMKYGGAA